MTLSTAEQQDGSPLAGPNSRRIDNDDDPEDGIVDRFFGTGGDNVFVGVAADSRPDDH